MKLTDLQPMWVNFVPPHSMWRYRDQHCIADYGAGQLDDTPEQSEAIAEADGVSFLCPTCFAANGDAGGTETVVCWFKDRPNVPADALPGPWPVGRDRNLVRGPHTRTVGERRSRALARLHQERGGDVMGLFDSLSGLASDVIDIAIAPVVIVTDVAAAVVKPVADGARAVVEEVKELTS